MTKDLAALATIMATARQTSLENEHCYYFVIIPSCLHFTMLARNPTTGLVCVPLNQIRRTKDFFLCSSCHQNCKFGNFALLFCREQHGLVISACCTCSTLIFPQSTNQVLNLCSCRCRCRCCS